MGVMFLVVSGMVLRITGADNVSEGSDCTEVRREAEKEENSNLDCSWQLSLLICRKREAGWSN